MGRTTARTLVAAWLAALGILASAALSEAQRPPKPRGELRVVDATPYQWAWVTLNVFEHLLELDQDGRLVLALATGWRWIDDRTLEVNLRRGVRFHNGEVFDAEIVKLNVEQSANLGHVFHLGSFLSFDPGTRVEIVDSYTVRIFTPKPDGATLARLSYIHLGNRQFFESGGWGQKHW